MDKITKSVLCCKQSEKHVSVLVLKKNNKEVHSKKVWEVIKHIPKLNVHNFSIKYALYRNVEYDVFHK